MINIKFTKRKKVLLIMFLLLGLSPMNVYAMHIMEGFLPKEWAIFWTVVMIPFFILGIRNLNKTFIKYPDKKLFIALAGAFVFVLSSLKIPSVTGSCSHPTGVGLGAILFGPSIMVVVGAIVLLFQALLLAHGGITTFGANAFSMVVAGPFIAYFVYKFLRKSGVKTSIAVFFGAMLGDLITYVITAMQLGIAFPDPIGGITTSIVKFLGVFAFTQLPLAIGEGLLTSIVYNLLVEYKKEGGIDEIID